MKPVPWRLLLALCVVASLAPAGAVVPAPEAAGLARQVHARCVVAMLQDRCVAAGASAASTAPAAGTRVVVAGAGLVDAQTYAALVSASGEMCTLAERLCRAEPHGAACSVAQQLW